MNRATAIETLFRQRILIIEPSPTLVEAATATEAAYVDPDYSQLRTDQDWQQMRDRVTRMVEAIAPDYQKHWARLAEGHIRTTTIAGPGGDLPVRLLEPDEQPRAAVLHIHGGGWIMGAPEEADYKNARVMVECDAVVASVDYRLAPQHPFPAALDDCEAAALWFLDHVRTNYGIDTIFLRGESAGSHLSLITALRLRHRHGIRVAGICCEVALGDHTHGLPSRHHGVYLTNSYLQQVAALITNDGQELASSDISPLYATTDELRDMPPVLFVCGGQDALRDDSLLLFMRWLQSGNEAFIININGTGHDALMTKAWESEFADDMATHFINRCINNNIAGPPIVIPSLPKLAD